MVLVVDGVSISWHHGRTTGGRVAVAVFCHFPAVLGVILLPDVHAQ